VVVSLIVWLWSSCATGDVHPKAKSRNDRQVAVPKRGVLAITRQTVAKPGVVVSEMSTTFPSSSGPVLYP
jgi:hypothetical protein